MKFEDFECLSDAEILELEVIFAEISDRRELDPADDFLGKAIRRLRLAEAEVSKLVYQLKQAAERLRLTR